MANVRTAQSLKDSEVTTSISESAGQSAGGLNEQGGDDRRSEDSDLVCPKRTDGIILISEVVEQRGGVRIAKGSGAMGGKEQRNSRFEMLESSHLHQQVCRTVSGRQRKHRQKLVLCTEVTAHCEERKKVFMRKITKTQVDN